MAFSKINLILFFAFFAISILTNLHIMQHVTVNYNEIEENSRREIKEEKNTNNTNNPKRRIWNNWPATAYEEVGHALVTKGNLFYYNAREILAKRS